MGQQPAVEAEADAPAARPTGIEEIVVTSRKRTENVQDVPIAISAFDERRLEQMQTRNIAELDGLVPSMLINRTDITPGAMTVEIRGLGSTEVEKTADPAVMVTVDGVPRGAISGAALDGFDIERVEVLRGPQGTLYGRNTIGGAINIRRSRPTGEFGGKLGLTVGEFGRLDYKAILNLPAVLDERLSIKLAYSLFRDDGAIKSRWWGDYGPDKDRQNVSGTFLFQPTENMEWLLTVEHFRDRGGSTRLLSTNVAAGVIPPAPPGSVFDLGRHLGEHSCNFLGYCNWPNPDWGSADNDAEKTAGDLTLDYDAVTLEGNWELENVTLTSVTGWIDEEEDIEFDWDGSPYPISESHRPQDFRQFSQEIRATGRLLDDRLDYTAGVYFYWSDNESRQFLKLGLPCFAIVGGGAFGHPACAPDQFRMADLSFLNIFPRQEGKQDTHAYAAFAHLTYEILPNLSASVGGRYTRETKKFIGKNGSSGWSGPFDTRSSDETTWREFTPRYDLNWQVTDDFLAYVSYSAGFHSGVYNGRNSRPEDIGPADPETVQAWEVGFKSDWLDNRLRVNFAAYQTDYKDKQQGVILIDDVLGTLTVVNNAGEVEVKGLELEVTAMPASWLTLGYNYSYLDGKYEEYMAQLVAGRGVTDNSGTPFGEWEYNISSFASATFPVGPGDLNFFYSFRHLKGPGYDPLYADPRRVTEWKDMHDASINYEFEAGGRNYSASLFLNNITDVDTGLRMNIVNPWGSFSYPVTPRHWGLALTADF
jgi:iron complex outermembrane receptor protein